MDVNHHARPQARQYLLIEKGDVSTGLGGVRGVDEQYVTVTECCESVEIEALDRRDDQLGDPLDARGQEVRRIRLDACEVQRSAEILPVDASRHQRGPSAPDLDHLSRAEMTQDGLP